MTEQEQQEIQDLYEDHQNSLAEEHLLRQEEERIALMKAYERNTREAAVDMADSLYSKHGNYPSALIDACHTLIMLGGARAISDLVKAAHSDPNEEINTSPF